MKLSGHWPRKKNIQINFDRNSSTGFIVYADDLRLKQVILNLLSNACKYNNPEGSITIDLEHLDHNLIRLSVSDTGIGIATEKQADLFKLYQRLGLEETPIKGTGLGLNIVKKLVELMNGEISFESTPGTGTTFYIDLPGSELHKDI